MFMFWTGRAFIVQTRWDIEVLQLLPLSELRRQSPSQLDLETHEVLQLRKLLKV